MYYFIHMEKIIIVDIHDNGTTAQEHNGITAQRSSRLTPHASRPSTAEALAKAVSHLKTTYHYNYLKLKQL